jgi:hypothetical protein
MVISDDQAATSMQLFSIKRAIGVDFVPPGFRGTPLLG